MPRPENPEDLGPPHPEQPHIRRMTQFDAYLKGFRGDPATGELILTIGVRPDQKMAAFKLTDNFMTKYLFDVYKAPKKVRAKRDVSDEILDGEHDD